MRRMRRTKAQLTVFMILAIVILVIAGIAFYVASSYELEVDGFNLRLQKTALDKSAFAVVVKGCIDEVGASAAYLISDRGGYIYDFDPVFYSQFHQIAYSIDYGNKVAPSRKFMEEEISSYIEQNLPLCINNFKDFPGYEIEFRDVSAKTSISEDDIRIKATYPIEISRDESIITISDFSAVIPIRLGYVLDVRDSVIDNILGSDTLDLSFFASQGLKVTVIAYDGETTLYAIEDEASDIQDRPYVFHTAVKEHHVRNHAPEMQDISEQRAFVGEPFYLKINADDPENDQITFSDDTVLFNINGLTGEIDFTPWIGDKGDHIIEITARDKAHEAKKNFNLSIGER